MEPSTNATTEAAPAHPLKDLLPARQWVELHGHPVFPSYDSFDWFLRRHQAEFATCPDWIVTGRGRFCGPGMAAFVRTLLDKDTRENLQRQAAQAPAKPAVKAPRGRPRKVA